MMKRILMILLCIASFGTSASTFEWPNEHPPKNPIKYFMALKNNAGSDWGKDYVILATVDHQNHPQQRIVHIASLTTDGLVFNTNPHSNKAAEFTEHPVVGLLYFLHHQEEVIQVRVTGDIVKLDKVHAGFEGDNAYLIKPTAIKFTLYDPSIQKSIITYQTISYMKHRENWHVSQSSYTTPLLPKK